MPNFSRRRAAAIFAAIGLAFCALIVRVCYLQTYGREQTIRRADRQQHMTETLFARRGSVFDANGAILACTVQGRSLYIDPKFMGESLEDSKLTQTQIDQVIKRLADLIDRSPKDIEETLKDRADDRFVCLADNIDEPTASAIEKLDIPGCGIMPTSIRNYPMGSIAAHILGGVRKDGVGLDGLELKFDKLLAGHDGYKRTEKDAARRGFYVAAEDYLPPQQGQHLVLTIDANIEMIAEQELAASCQKFRAQRGEAIVMDPNTGAVLAMANYPTFNPQNIEDSTPKDRRNNCLVVPYEPGSTIKPFIAGPALYWHLTHPDEIFKVHGPTYHTPYGRKVMDVHGYDQLAMWDVLVKSSNIGMSMLGERMGNASLYKAVSGFGFGRTTGLEMPGEDQGLVHPLPKWTKYSTESVSQGYEIMVTPMQLARAFCTYANGGRLVQPYLLKGVLDSQGETISRAHPAATNKLPQVMDSTTASQMRRILCDVLVRGTARVARSSIYNIFGKTGTAHVSQGLAGYSDNRYTSSFIGGAPYENPQLVIAFIIHEPDRAYADAHGLSHYGGAVAAPGAAKVLERCLGYMQVPPSPDLPVPPANIANVLYAYNAAEYKMPTAKTPAQIATARD